MTEFYDGATINQWAEAFAANGKFEIAAQLHDDKLAGINALNELNLPSPYGEMVLASQYLEDPLQYFSQIETDLVYINIIPLTKDQKKHTRFGISKEEAIQFIDSHLPVELIDKFTVGVYEYYPNVYGGSVIINPSGHILMEFGKGNCLDYTRGSYIPEFCAEADANTGIMHYNSDDIELREAAWRTLRYIPHNSEGINTNFLPGYYEFALYRQPKSGILQPAFLDYKDSPVYQLID